MSFRDKGGPELQEGEVSVVVDEVEVGGMAGKRPDGVAPQVVGDIFGTHFHLGLGLAGQQQSGGHVVGVAVEGGANGLNASLPALNVNDGVHLGGTEEVKDIFKGREGLNLVVKKGILSGDQRGKKKEKKVNRYLSSLAVLHVTVVVLVTGNPRTVRGAIQGVIVKHNHLQHTQGRGFKTEEELMGG